MWDSIILGGYVLLAFLTANSIFLALDRLLTGFTKPKASNEKSSSRVESESFSKPKLTVSETVTQSSPNKKLQGSPARELGGGSKIDMSSISLSG